MKVKHWQNVSLSVYTFSTHTCMQQLLTKCQSKCVHFQHTYATTILPWVNFLRTSKKVQLNEHQSFVDFGASNFHIQATFKSLQSSTVYTTHWYCGTCIVLIVHSPFHFVLVCSSLGFPTATDLAKLHTRNKLLITLHTCYQSTYIM